MWHYREVLRTHARKNKVQEQSTAHLEVHVHPRPRKKEPEGDKTIHVGTIARGPSGYMLMTSSRDLALVSGKESLMAWEERRVVISGVCRGLHAIEITSIDEMMSEGEIRECVSFIAGRYRQRADQHVRNSLDAAIRCGSPQQIAIWQAISSHFKVFRGERASDAFLSTFLDGQ